MVRHTTVLQKPETPAPLRDSRLPLSACSLALRALASVSKSATPMVTAFLPLT